MIRRLHTELLKVTTTRLLWFILGAATVTAGTALAVNLFQGLQNLVEVFEPPSGATAEQLAEMTEKLEAEYGLPAQASNIYTSGQSAGLLIMLLLGISVVTSEFRYGTVSMTFLSASRRSSIIVGKLAAALVLAALVWAVTTIMNMAIGASVLTANGFGTALSAGEVLTSVALNLVAYLLWAVFGVAFGTVLRNQLSAMLVGTLLYLVSTPVTFQVFDLARAYLTNDDGLYRYMVLVPSVASSVMVSPVPQFFGSPPQWVGAAVLLGYGAVTGALGLFITARRDIVA